MVSRSPVHLEIPALAQARNGGPQNPSRGHLLFPGSHFPHLSGEEVGQVIPWEAQSPIFALGPHRGPRYFVALWGRPSQPASNALPWHLRPEARVRCKGLIPHWPGEGNTVCAFLTPVSRARSLKRRDPVFALAAAPDSGSNQRSAGPGKVSSPCSQARPALPRSPFHHPPPHYLSPAQDMSAWPRG